jgi:hypothetical protein
MLRSLAPDDAEWRHRIDRIVRALGDGAAVTELAASLGLQRGVTGYIYDTVPVAIYAWLRHYGDFRATLESALDCGGDTDTTGAIAGALAGATVGPQGIPPEWLDGICDWPRSTALLRRVAEQLAEQKQDGRARGPVRYFLPAVVPRNLLFLAVVLAHGFRRLGPPYRGHQEDFVTNSTSRD